MFLAMDSYAPQLLGSVGTSAINFKILIRDSGVNIVTITLQTIE